MKKFSVLLVLVLLISCSFGTTVFASNSLSDNNFDTVIFVEKEVTDLNLIFDKAKKNITDYDVPKANMNSTDDMRDDGLNVETYTTTQLLKSEKDSLKGAVKNTYVTSNFAIITDKTEDYSGKLSNSIVASTESDLSYLKSIGTTPILVAGDKGDEAWDNTGGVKAVARIYWTTYSNYQGTNLTFYKLTQATGTWTRADTNLTIYNKDVRLATNGGSWDLSTLRQVTSWYHPTSNSFTYNAPTSWSPVSDTSDIFQVGVAMNCDLKRGTDSWAFDFSLYL